MEALECCEVGAKEHLYSNFGFMTLGHVLAAVAGAAYEDLLRSRVLDPLGMTRTGCPPAESARMPAYSGATRVSWWSMPLGGAGGVGGPIGDLATYLMAHLSAPDGLLGAAMATATTRHADGATTMGYGWTHEGGGWWKNGGTGGFRAFAAFHRPTGTAVALLANSAQADVVDSVGFETATELARARL